MISWLLGLNTIEQLAMGLAQTPEADKERER